MNLFWREGVELLLDRVFPLLASHSFCLPFSQRWPHSPLFTPGSLIGILSCFPTLRYISTYGGFFFPKSTRARKINSRRGPWRICSLPFTRLQRIRSSVLFKAARERRDYVYIYPKKSKKKGNGEKEGGERKREKQRIRIWEKEGRKHPRELNDNE